MHSLNEFEKSCPAGFCLSERPRSDQAYKYYVHGKGCTLGVLFEDSVNIYFEWLEEGGVPVSYPPEIRYKSWSKVDFTRLLCMGVWEVSGAGAVAA